MRLTMSLSIAAFAGALAFCAAGQARDPAPDEPRIVTSEAPRPAVTDNKNPEDIEFLTDALRTSLAEVQIGALATQRSDDTRVREYGAKLKSHHTQQAAEIKRLLGPVGVTIPAEPSAEAQSHHAALARLSGRKFDNAFVEMMIASHKEAIEQYGAQTHANPDRALADFASKSLPTLREHLATAESLR